MPGHALLLVSTDQRKAIEAAISTTGKGNLVLECLDKNTSGEWVADPQQSVTLYDWYLVRASPVWAHTGMLRTSENMGLSKQIDLDQGEGLFEIELQDERASLLMRLLDTDTTAALYNLLTDSSTKASRSFITDTINTTPTPDVPWTYGDLCSKVFTAINRAGNYGTGNKFDLADIDATLAASVPLEVFLMGIPALMCLDLLAHWSPFEFVCKYDSSQSVVNNSFGACRLDWPETDPEPASVTAWKTYLMGVLQYRMWGGASKVYPFVTIPQKIHIYEKDPSISSTRRSGLPTEYYQHKVMTQTGTVSADANSIMPYWSKLAYGTAGTVSDRSHQKSLRQTGFHAVYMGFLPGMLNIEFPLSLVSYNWSGGAPVTEVHLTNVEPIKTLLNGPLGHFLRNIPLRVSLDGDITFPEKTSVGAVADHFVITNCTSGTAGVVKIKHSTAPGSVTPDTGVDEQNAWLGTAAFLGLNMACWAIPCEVTIGGVDVYWLILDTIQGAANWEEPTTGLSATQDSPGAATLCDG